MRAFLCLIQNTPAFSVIPHALLDSVGGANNLGALELTVHIWPLGQNCGEYICALGLLRSLPFLSSA